MSDSRFDSPSEARPDSTQILSTRQSDTYHMSELLIYSADAEAALLYMHQQALRREESESEVMCSAPFWLLPARTTNPLRLPQGYCNSNKS